MKGGSAVIYLSQMLGKPVVDATGDEIGTINDIAIATGEVFPRVTSLAFRGPDKTPFMLSWRKYVAEFDGERVALNVAAPDIRFSYLQPDEVLLARDLLNKQIVDTQGMKVVRVNDLKLSESRNQMRLLGAEVGMRGIFRAMTPVLERWIDRLLRAFGRELPENLIAWNYMDLLDRDLSQVKLSVTHKRLHELHPADVADIMEQLAPSQRAKVFEHLDNTQAAEAISELEDELQADVIDDLSERRASDLLAEMDPDDAADIIGDLDYEKAERLLRLMGVEDASAIRGLLGYKEKTAGGIMTPEVTTVTDDMTVQQVIEHLREIAGEQESIYYVYVVEGDGHLTGVISLRDLLLSSPDTPVAEIAERDLFTAEPDDDQEDVAEDMSKYDLLALPVVDETGKLLGIVTVDDALDVLEEEAEEDLELATGRRPGSAVTGVWRWVSRDGWLAVWIALFVALAFLTRVDTLAYLASPLLFAALLSPLVMRLAEDVAGHAMSRVIETQDEDERQPFWQRLFYDGVAGIVLGIVLGAVGFGVTELIVVEGGPNLPLGLVIGNAFGLSAFLVAIAGTFAGQIAERRMDADKPVSQVLVAVSLMGIGAASFIAILVGGAMLSGMVSTVS
jgi:Mg2+ transporter MgtE